MFDIENLKINLIRLFLTLIIIFFTLILFGISPFEVFESIIYDIWTPWFRWRSICSYWEKKKCLVLKLHSYF